MASIGLENLTGILAFVHAAEARSFTAAARQLGMSPSGVSKAIARLEGGYRVRLLHRTSRSVTMTPEGRAFYERCRQILADVEDAEQVLSSAHGTPRGRLRVTIPLSVGRIHLARLLPVFQQRYPDITVEARATDRIVDLVEEGYDVAVRLGTPPDSRLVARQLIGGRFVTCAAPSYLRSHGTPTTLEELESHNCARFVVPSTGVARDWVFRREGTVVTVPVAGNLTFDHAECLVEAACSGTAVIQIGSYVLDEALRSRRLEAILTPFEVESPALWVMYPQNRHLTPRVRAFVDFLVEMAGAGQLGGAAMPSP
ncbi:MAG: LysR family transcriptional regulator [Betaproteobacteria bacterium]|nr:LysR family transcriptional regulator [Betaproteobacteria bacterium]